MRKDLLPYPSACQRKTSQQFISTVLVLSDLHTCGLSVDNFVRNGVNPGHTRNREMLHFAYLKKVCSLSPT